MCILNLHVHVQCLYECAFLGVVTVYDSCVGSAIHKLDGLGHVTCLDLLWTDKQLTLAIATSVTQPRPGLTPMVVSQMMVCTCQDGREWLTTVIRPHQETTTSNPTIVSILTI